MEEYAFTLANTPAGLERLQAQIQSILQASDVRPSVISPINIAVGEWIENIIQHAYADGATHQISVHCRVGPAQIVLRVVDDGRPFDPRKYPAIEKTDAAIQGVHTGRGIHLIRNLLDRMDYERQDGHNVLILTKNLT